MVDTIDFLLGFSNEMNVEDIKGICDDMMNKFLDLRFEDAEKEWSNYLRQYPNNYLLMYELAYKQKQIIYIFGLEPINGIGVGLQIALFLAQNNEYERVKIELEQVLDILEQGPREAFSISDIDFFKNTNFKILEESNNISFSTYGYRILVDQIFDCIEEKQDFQEIKARLEKSLP